MSNTDLDDETLIVRYAHGDTAAFDKLYKRHELHVWRYLERSVCNTVMSNELLQETWFTLARNSASLESAPRFSVRLFTVAHDRMNSSRRTAAAPARGAAAANRGPIDGGSVDGLVQAVLQLPGEQREAYLLHVEGELNIRDIAEITNSATESVQDRLQLARVTLGDLLTGRAGDGPLIEDPLIDVDQLYRRLSALDPSRPEEWVHRKVQAYAAQQAAERALRAAVKSKEAMSPAAPAPRIETDPLSSAPKQGLDKRLVILGAIGAAALAGVFVVPRLLTSGDTVAEKPSTTVAAQAVSDGSGPDTPASQSDSTPTSTSQATTEAASGSSSQTAATPDSVSPQSTAASSPPERPLPAPALVAQTPAGPRSSAPSVAQTPVAPHASGPSVAQAPVAPHASAPSVAQAPVAPRASAPSTHSDSTGQTGTTRQQPRAELAAAPGSSAGPQSTSTASEFSDTSGQASRSALAANPAPDPQTTPTAETNPPAPAAPTPPQPSSESSPASTATSMPTSLPTPTSAAAPTSAAVANNSPDQLTRAAEYGDMRALHTALAGNVDVNARDKDGHTALILAIQNNHSAAVKELMAHGADPKATDSQGNTPLKVARIRNDSSILVALQDHSAHSQPRASAAPPPPTPPTPAAPSQPPVSTPAAPALVPPDALCRAAENGDVGALNAALADNADVNARDAHGHVALILAIQNDHVAIVKELIAHGADLRASDSRGNTPLKAARLRNNSLINVALSGGH